MSTLGVTCPFNVRVTVISPARHRCPFKDENDHGSVEVSWTTRDETVELHALADLINADPDALISHEEWTAALAEAITAGAKVDGLTVVSRWHTAGLEVRVTNRTEEGAA